jgi:glutathione S-transferase
MVGFGVGCLQPLRHFGDEELAVTLYYMSGSPYAWRAWLALAYKGIEYKLTTLSYDAGDLNKPEFAALTPRRRVPVLVDDDFVLFESAAIVEYVEERWPGEPRLFAADLRHRAIERRMMREADAYVAAVMERLVTAILFTPTEKRSPERIARICADLKKELAVWEATIAGDYLAGALSAVDFTLYPQIALVERMGKRNPGTIPPDFMGPKLAGWMRRMAALPVVQGTWPPHWR